MHGNYTYKGQLKLDELRSDSAGQENDMKLLADVNVEKPIVDYLKSIGNDVKWIPDYDCMLPDDELLEIANSENRIMLTNDKDFGELVFRQNRIASGIILIRMKGDSSEKKVAAITKLFKDYPEKIINHMVVVTRNKIRFVSLWDLK